MKNSVLIPFMIAGAVLAPADSARAAETGSSGDSGIVTDAGAEAVADASSGTREAPGAIGEPPGRFQETIVVTATKSEKEVSGVSASVEVISQGDVEASGALNLKAILERTPGVNLQYGTFPAASSASRSSVSIRGLGATGTLFLLDGRRLAGEAGLRLDF